MRLASAGIVDIESSAARAASGHAAVPSTTLMNSRRLMPSIGLPTCRGKHSTSARSRTLLHRGISIVLTARFKSANGVVRPCSRPASA